MDHVSTSNKFDVLGDNEEAQYVFEPVVMWSTHTVGPSVWVNSEPTMQASDGPSVVMKEPLGTSNKFVALEVEDATEMTTITRSSDSIQLGTCQLGHTDQNGVLDKVPMANSALLDGEEEQREVTMSKTRDQL